MPPNRFNNRIERDMINERRQKKQNDLILNIIIDIKIKLKIKFDVEI